MDSNDISYVISDTVITGTAEFYDEGKQLVFHSREDLQAWLHGESFRLIIHWTKSPPPPQYDKAERIKKRR